MSALALSEPPKIHEALLLIRQRSPAGSSSKDASLDLLHMLVDAGALYQAALATYGIISLCHSVIILISVYNVLLCFRFKFSEHGCTTNSNGSKGISSASNAFLLSLGTLCKLFQLQQLKLLAPYMRRYSIDMLVR